MIVMNSTISGNTADFFGGGIINYGTATVSNCTLSGNSVSSSNGSADGRGGGGGIYNGGTATVSNCTLSGNSATFSRAAALLKAAAR